MKEGQSRKSIKPEDKIQKAVEELARDIAIIESDPGDWGWWVGHFFREAGRRIKDQVQEIRF